MIKASNRVKFLFEDETKRLYTAINNDTSRHQCRNKAIFYIAKYCALRASEVSLLRMSDYDVQNKLLFCSRLKNSKNNVLKIVEQKTLSAFEDYYFSLNRSPEDYIFKSQENKAISRKMLDKLMKCYCFIANIDASKSHFHVLKHTRAMELIEFVDIRDVQFWLGHKSISNTLIYLDYTYKAKETLFKKIALVKGKE
jgi:integrase/recombinase XerD